MFGCSNKNDVKKTEVLVKIDFEEIESSNRLDLSNFYEIEGFFEDDLDYALDVFKKDCKRSKRYDLFKDICHKAQFEKDGRKFFIINFSMLFNNTALITKMYQ